MLFWISDFGLERRFFLVIVLGVREAIGTFLGWIEEVLVQIEIETIWMVTDQVEEKYF